ncbi:MAG: protein-L-isoaspartate(D-aspartate) O-methyltransferase [Bacteroidota bacterium]
MANNFVDTFRHKGLRRKLVEELKLKGITDELVLNSIGLVPRHFFLDSSFLEYAYQDKAFPIGAGQTISQPYTVAYQSQLLKAQKGSKIMEIGTGSGYQSCVLLEMGVKVYTIERQKLLYDKTRPLLESMGYTPKFFFGDGYKGLPSFAPFDGVIVTAGAPFIPEPLLQQLKIGAVLVIPVGDGANQIMTTVTRLSEKEFEKKELGACKFVPLLGDKAW